MCPRRNSLLVWDFGKNALEQACSCNQIFLKIFWWLKKKGISASPQIPFPVDKEIYDFFFILFMSDSLSLNAVIMADCRRLRRRVWQTKRRPFKVVFSSLNAFAISCISSQSSLSLQTAPSLKKLGLIWHPRNLNGLSPVDIMSGEKPSSMRRFLSSSDSENPIVKTRVLSELIKRPEKNNQNPEKSSSQ